MVFRVNNDDIGYNVDINNIGISNVNAWVSGCDFTINGNDITIASGSVLSNSLIETSIETTLTITPPTTNGIIYLIVYNNTTNVIEILSGTENVTPLPPNYVINDYVVLYMIIFPISGTSLSEGNIRDLRVLGSQELVYVPIGGIIAWHRDILGDSNPLTLDDNFVMCNGGTINDSESTLNGATIPLLNSAPFDDSVTSIDPAHTNNLGRFLRGSTESGVLGGVSAHEHDSTSFESGDAFEEGSTVIELGLTNHLPPYMDVIWIMRIK